MRILYVEDNEVNQALVERVVRAKRYSIVFEEEGEQALDVLVNDHTIDLILLDIELAGSFNGLDVIRTLRARNDHRPVVAITAYAMMGDRERILDAGCDQYLPKPLVITDLLNLLEHYEAEFETKAKAAPEPAAAEASEDATAAAEKPGGAEQPAAAVQPITEQPTAAAQPAATEQPAKVEQPVTVPPAMEQPTAAAQPAATEQLTTEPPATEQPTKVEQPSPAAQPAVTEQPVPLTPPVASEKPAAADHAKNGGSAQLVPAPETAPAPASPVKQDEFAKDPSA